MAFCQKYVLTSQEVDAIYTEIDSFDTHSPTALLKWNVRYCHSMVKSIGASSVPGGLLVRYNRLGYFLFCRL